MRQKTKEKILNVKVLSYLFDAHNISVIVINVECLELDGEIMKGWKCCGNKKKKKWGNTRLSVGYSVSVFVGSSVQKRAADTDFKTSSCKD